MSDLQKNERSRLFVTEAGLENRIQFLYDPKSRLIQALGVLLEDPEPIEKGVPHPTTVLLDEQGRIERLDVRRDYHVWLDPSAILDPQSEAGSGPAPP